MPPKRLPSRPSKAAATAGVAAIEQHQRCRLRDAPESRSRRSTAGARSFSTPAHRCWPLEKPPFLVTDNGSSLLARHFRGHIDGRDHHARIQYQTPAQPGLLERFNQTLKTEEVYWRLYCCPGEATAPICPARYTHRLEPEHVACTWR